MQRKLNSTEQKYLIECDNKDYRYKIQKLLNDKDLLLPHIDVCIDRELKRQKSTGKIFLSDREIDDIVKNAISDAMSGETTESTPADEPTLYIRITRETEQELIRMFNGVQTTISVEQLETVIDTIIKKDLGDRRK
jgi:hypothetical protein